MESRDLSGQVVAHDGPLSHGSPVIIPTANGSVPGTIQGGYAVPN